MHRYVGTEVMDDQARLHAHHCRQNFTQNMANGIRTFHRSERHEPPNACPSWRFCSLSPMDDVVPPSDSIPPIDDDVSILSQDNFVSFDDILPPTEGNFSASPDISEAGLPSSPVSDEISSYASSGL